MKIEFNISYQQQSSILVGLRPAVELSKRHTVTITDSIEETPTDSVVCFVKKVPPFAWFERAKLKRNKVVFFPVDIFQSEEEIQKNSLLISQFDGIALHCLRLHKFLSPLCKNIAFVEHPIYSMQLVIGKSKRESFFWSGYCENLFPVLEWFSNRKFDYPLEILTDLGDAHKIQTHVVDRCQSAGIDLQSLLTKIRIRKWSERSEHRLFHSSIAFPELREPTFNQLHKPPLKMQLAIMHGVPVFTNHESYAHEYAKNIDGIELPKEFSEDLMSEEYLNVVSKYARTLRTKTSVSAVADSYEEFFKKIL